MMRFLDWGPNVKWLAIVLIFGYVGYVVVSAMLAMLAMWFCWLYLAMLAMSISVWKSNTLDRLEGSADIYADLCIKSLKQ